MDNINRAVHTESAHRCTEKLYIFGYNSNSISVYQSETAREKIIVDTFSAETATAAETAGLHILSVPAMDYEAARIVTGAKDTETVSVMVINTESDEENLCICHSICQALHAAEDPHVMQYVQVYVYGDEGQSGYEQCVADSACVIRCVDRYDRIARDFVVTYPLAGFMTAEQIDYNTSLLREGVHVNVVLLGFGRINQRILLTSVATNQFVSAKNRDVVSEPVRYYVFDKHVSRIKTGYNKTYYRYEQMRREADETLYLPLPPLPADEGYCELDVMGEDLADIMQRTLETDVNGVHVVVISLGNDTENLLMAKRMMNAREAWGIPNIHVIAHVSAHSEEKVRLAEHGCLFFGDEMSCVYHIDRITDDAFTVMAMMRNTAYDIEYRLSQGGDGDIVIPVGDDVKIEMEKSWYAKSAFDRTSSIFGCLSIRSKLNMMGLDYRRFDEEGEALTEEEYLCIYAGDDMPVYRADTIGIYHKRMVQYTLDFPASRRRTLAEQEHLRWNAYMISRGTIPSTKEQIVHEVTVKNQAKRYTNGKNPAEGRHGNLTTFAGLTEYRRMLAMRDGRDEASYDVIKYDYQLMDDAYWLLTASGYKIVRL